MDPEVADGGGYQGLAGEIIEVSGRQAAGGQRGLPAIEKIKLRLEDGTEMDLGAPSSGANAPLDLVTPIYAQSFARIDRAQPSRTPICPICLQGNPSREEHVPQAPLGGSVMTMTCEPCNSLLGSRVETELQDWFDPRPRGPQVRP